MRNYRRLANVSDLGILDRVRILGGMLPQKPERLRFFEQEVDSERYFVGFVPGNLYDFLDEGNLLKDFVPRGYNSFLYGLPTNVVTGTATRVVDAVRKCYGDAAEMFRGVNVKRNNLVIAGTSMGSCSASLLARDKEPRMFICATGGYSLVQGILHSPAAGGRLRREIKELSSGELQEIDDLSPGKNLAWPRNTRFYFELATHDCYIPYEHQRILAEGVNGKAKTRVQRWKGHLVAHMGFVKRMIEGQIPGFD